MIKNALFVRLEALPGKAAEAEGFLHAALAMANEEPTTPIWFALKLAPTTFGVFDAFHTEADRQRHLSGPIAQALMTRGQDLFVFPLNIEPIDVLGLKNAD